MSSFRPIQKPPGEPRPPEQKENEGGLKEFFLKQQKEEAEMAIKSGLPAHFMTRKEVEYFPHLLSNLNDAKAYLYIRNHICAKWRRSISTFLSLDTAISEFQDAIKPIATRIYQYLYRFGYINFGIIKDRSAQPAKRKNKSVVVIGAGWAGLCAAHHLASLGYDVKLLEARQRVGGRVFTAEVGAPIDLGASIVTGPDQSPVTLVCEQIGAPLYQIGHEGKIYDIDGEELDEEDDKRIEIEFNRLLDAACKRKTEQNKRAVAGWVAEAEGKDASTTLPNSNLRRQNIQKLINSLSLGKTLQSLVDRYLPLVKDEEDQQFERRVLQWHIANLEYGCGNDLEPVSLAHWDQDDTFEFTGAHCFVPSGFSYLVEQLAEDFTKFPNAKLLYGQVVQRIDSSYVQMNGKVSVQTLDDETGSSEVHTADAILCTVPLGTLQQNLIEFVPPLPPRKQKALKNLGFGLLNKIVLHFENCFWNERHDYFGTITSEDPRERGRTYMFWNFIRCTGKPIIVGLFAGKAAVDMENEDMDTTLERALSALRRIFGMEKVPDPVSWTVTAWRSEVFSLGSYSYIARNGTGKDYDVMASPIYDQHLFFAGEHTHREAPSTVLGAALSGLREAGLIDYAFEKLYVNQSSPLPGQSQQQQEKQARAQRRLGELLEDSDEEMEEETVTARASRVATKRSISSRQIDEEDGDDFVPLDGDEEDYDSPDAMDDGQDLYGEGDVHARGWRRRVFTKSRDAKKPKLASNELRKSPSNTAAVASSSGLARHQSTTPLMAPAAMTQQPLQPFVQQPVAYMPVPSAAVSPSIQLPSTVRTMSFAEAKNFVKNSTQLALFFYNFETQEDRQYLEEQLTLEYLNKNCPQSSPGIVMIDAAAQANISAFVGQKMTGIPQPYKRPQARLSTSDSAA